jgi:hypothetical protein
MANGGQPGDVGALIGDSNPQRGGGCGRAWVVIEEKVENQIIRWGRK